MADHRSVGCAQEATVGHERDVPLMNERDVPLMKMPTTGLAKSSTAKGVARQDRTSVMLAVGERGTEPLGRTRRPAGRFVTRSLRGLL
jgi:hypothetical protein